MIEKIALDIHGVIDTNPEFFARLTEALWICGWEIHVMTGSHLEEKGIRTQLEAWGIKYTHLFSISDYHRKKGTKMWGDPQNPWMDAETWNKTKADYCEQHNIPLCFDDRDAYRDYFNTPFARFYSRGYKP